MLFSNFGDNFYDLKGTCRGCVETLGNISVLEILRVRCLEALGNISVFEMVPVRCFETMGNFSVPEMYQ